MPGLDVGVDFYYKNARDLLDDGQFGAAYVLTGFNYAKAENVGVELKVNYVNGNSVPTATSRSRGSSAPNVSSKSVPVRRRRARFHREQLHLHRPLQLVSGSAGASYLWKARVSPPTCSSAAGLRSGSPTPSHCPSMSSSTRHLARVQVPGTMMKPTTVRFDVVNVFDRSIRSGTARASACSRRNTARVADSLAASRRSFEAAARMQQLRSVGFIVRKVVPSAAWRRMEMRHGQRHHRFWAELADSERAIRTFACQGCAGGRRRAPVGGESTGQTAGSCREVPLTKSRFGYDAVDQFGVGDETHEGNL